MAERKETMLEWLGDARTQGCKRVELRLKIDRSLIRVWKIGGENDNDGGAGLEDLAAQIVKRAEREGLGQQSTRVTFEVLGFVEAYGGEHCDRTLLVVDGGHSKGSRIGEGDHEVEPTMAGMNAALVKMVGEQFRLLMSSQESRHVHAEAIIDRQAKEITNLQGERVRVWELLEKVSSMKIEREQIQQTMKLEEKRDAFLFEKLSMMTPVLLNRLMGGGPGKGSPFFGEEMVRQLLGSLSAQQTDAMLKNQPMSWNPEQLGLIAELTLAYNEREKMRRPLNAAPEPETSTPDAATSEDKPS